MNQVKFMQDMKQFIKETISFCLNIDIDAIDSQTSISKCPEWDSLAHMQILAILSDKFEFELTAEVIMHLTSYEIILNYLISLKNNE